MFKTFATSSRHTKILTTLARMSCETPRQNSQNSREKFTCQWDTSLHHTREYCTADQRLCFRYTDSTNPLLAASFMLWLYSLVCVGPGRKLRLLALPCEGSYTLTCILICIFYTAEKNCQRGCETTTQAWLLRISSTVKMYCRSHMSLCVRNLTILVPTRYETNRAVQSQKVVRGWKFCI